MSDLMYGNCTHKASVAKSFQGGWLTMYFVCTIRRMNTRIAVVGLGEVGRCYVAALAQVPEVRLSLCDPAPQAAALALAARLQLPIHAGPGPWLAECDWTFGCVVGDAAAAVARACLSHMQGRAGLYADFSTAGPQDMRDAGQFAAARELAFVDVAIMGAIAQTGARTPLLAAGAAIGTWQDLMRRLGAQVTVLPEGSPGDAVSLKLLRSAFTKGLEALTVEVMTAAERQGVRKAFYDVLADIDQGSLPRYLETLVTTHLVHARRRRKEVSEVRAQFRASGVPSDVLPAVEAAFARTIDALDAVPIGEPEQSVEGALQWLSAVRAADMGP